MRLSEWIISCTCGQTVVYLFHTTLNSVDLAEYEIFHAKVLARMVKQTFHIIHKGL